RASRRGGKSLGQRGEGSLVGRRSGRCSPASLMAQSHVARVSRPIERPSQTEALNPGTRHEMSELARKRAAPDLADVCIIVECAYPYVSGGVSAWVHGLIRRQPDLQFRV